MKIKININGNCNICFLSPCPKVCFSPFMVKVPPLWGPWSETRRGALAAENMSHHPPCSSPSPTVCFPGLYQQCRLSAPPGLGETSGFPHHEFPLISFPLQGEGVLAGAGWALPACEWSMGSVALPEAVGSLGPFLCDAGLSHWLGVRPALT